MKIGFFLILFIVVLTFPAYENTYSEQKGAEYGSLNNSSTGSLENPEENTTVSSEEDFNRSKNASSGPVAISLEKPPFID